MVRGSVVAVLFAFASPAAFAETAPGAVERVLLLSGPADAAARLERELNERSSGRLFVVFRHEPKEGGLLSEPGFSEALNRYSPGAVVAVMGAKEGGWSGPLGGAAGILRARKAPLVLAHGSAREAAALSAALPPGADVVFLENGASLEGVAPAIQNRLGVARSAAAAARDERDRLARRAAEIHRYFDSDAEKARLAGLLAANPEDLSVLGRMAAIHRARIQFWHALTYLDRMAASPRASVPQRAEALSQAGELRLQIGDFPAAAADFRRALELKPGDAAFLRLLAEAMRERPEQALPYADRAAAAKGASARERARANLLAGDLRADIGDAAGAERNLKLALKDAPGDLDALLSMVRLKRGRGAQALPYAERASREAARAPLWLRAAAFRLSARVWLELGEHARAADELGRALRLDPEDLDALRLLVPIKSKLAPKQLAGLRWTGRAADAADAAEPAAWSEAEARLALRADPSDLEALRRLAELSRGRPAEAAAYAQSFMDVLWRAPAWQREDAALALVRLWRALGDEAKASLVLERILDLQSDSIASWRLAVETGHSEATVYEPSWVIGSYCTAASMRLALDDRAGAEEELKRALALQPADPWARELMARVKQTP